MLNQRLMRHLDMLGTNHDQTGIGKPGGEGFDLCGIAAGGHQFVQADAAAGVAVFVTVAFSEASEADKDVAAVFLLDFVEGSVKAVGGVGDPWMILPSTACAVLPWYGGSPTSIS